MKINKREVGEGQCSKHVLITLNNRQILNFDNEKVMIKKEAFAQNVFNDLMIFGIEFAWIKSYSASFEKANSYLAPNQPC